MNELLELERELGPQLQRAFDAIIPTDAARFADQRDAVSTTDATTEEVALTDESHSLTTRSIRRRMLGVAAAVVVVLAGGVALSRRDASPATDPGNNSSSTDAGPPAWYGLIAPSLPERFQSVALTFATDEQMWFVAINPIDGKTLEIQLASGGYSAEPTTTVDATGDWVETAQGWSVRTPAGLFVSVSCNIGLGGRDFVGTTNYCDFTSGIPPFTKDDIRAVANSLATTFDVSIFDGNLGEPSGDAIDTAEARFILSDAMALVATALPSQQISATDLGNGADHIYNVGPAASSPSDTLPAAGTEADVNTSIRILHGVRPSVTVASEPVINGYVDATVVSMFGAGGVYVRITTTDPSPASVTALEQLARDLIRADPTAIQAASPTINPNLVTTTTADQPTAANTPAGNTTTTLEPCPGDSSAPLVVVVNASRVDGTAKWWTNLLSSNLPTVNFADPMSAIDQAPTSRVFGLNGFECSIALVSDLTTGTADAVTIESLQALVAEPLPNGTSIVVVIGNDNLSNATTGVTTTSAS